MTEEEILEGSVLICEFMGFEKTDPHHYKVPNLFPLKEDSGWMELRADAMGFHKDWNLLIPVYNKLREELLYDRQVNSLFITAATNEEKYAMRDWPHLNEEGLFDITGSFLKVVDLIQWYNKTVK